MDKLKPLCEILNFTEDAKTVAIATGLCGS